MDRVSEILICSLRMCQPQSLSTNWNLGVPHAQCHLSHWERSDRAGDAKHRQRDPGEGLRPNDRPTTLTPTLSPPNSDLSDFDRFETPNWGQPELGLRGEGS